MPEEELPKANSDITPPSNPMQPGHVITPGTPPPSPAPETLQPSVSPKPKSRKLLWFILLVIIIVGAAVAAYLLWPSTTKQVVATKKDIPLFRYGAISGEVPDYPITYFNSDNDVLIADQMFEGLVGYQDQTKIIPLLATSWTNPDSSTWVFNLRQGVKFHTGRTMTAQDVKYSLDYAVAHQNDNNGGSQLFIASTIKEVDVTGTYQVKVITNGPDAVLLNRLSYLGIIDSKAKLGDYNAGTGPYVVKPGTKPTSDSIDLVASNDYWGGHVYTRELQFTINNDANQLAKETASGQFDMAGDFNNTQLSVIKRPYKPVYVSDLGPAYLGVNVKRANSPLNSLTVRQAVADALNIPAIISAAGLKATTANQLVPLELPGYNPAIPQPTYDLTKAKQLLASVKGSNSQLTLAYVSSDSPQVNEIVKELDAAGFNIKAVPVPDIDTLVNDTLAGQYDLFYLVYTSNTVDGLDILNTLLTGNQDYDNPQIDSLISQASGTFDQVQRIKQMQEIATIVYNDKPYIPLFTANRVFPVTNLSYNVSVDIPSGGPLFWKVYQN